MVNFTYTSISYAVDETPPRRRHLGLSLLLLMAVLSFATVHAQSYTADFSTRPTIDKYGFAADWPWNSTVTVNLGGIDYLITDAINGSFTWTESAIYFETAGDVSLHIKRKDGGAFKFYGVKLQYTNFKSPPYYVYPFLTVQYATTGSTQADELYDADRTLTVSKASGVAVSGSGVTLRFSGLYKLTLDDLIVGPASVAVAPTVTTAAASVNSATSATLGGNVTADGGTTVTERGIVYVSGSGTPTTSNTKVVIGNGTGSFSQPLTSLLPSTTYTARAYAINSVGTSYGSSVSFTTAASLSIGSVTPTPVCAGSAISFTYTSSAPGNSLAVYLNGPNTTNLLLANIASSNVSGAISATIPADRGTGTYSVSVSGSGASAASSTFTINALPNAPTTANISYCQNASAAQLTASGQNLRWYTSASGGTAFTSITPSTSAIGSTTYYVSQTDANGCESGRTPLTVTVNAIPSAPSVTNTSVVFCQNTTAASLQATATSGNTLNWYSSQGTALGSTAPTPSTTNLGTTFYQVSQRTGNGCESARVQITVTINAAPAVPTTSPASACQGGATVSLVNSVTAQSGNTLKWYTSPTSASLAAAPQVATSTTGSQVFYVSQTNANGCESSRAAITYTVNARPNAPSVQSPVTYCQNATALPLQATASSGGTLNFYTVSSGGTASIELTPQTQSSDVYYVSQTVNGCESSTRALITVTINALPPRPVVTTPVIYCQLATAAPLSATAATNNTLVWYGTNAIGGSAATTASIPPTTVVGTTGYYVSQRDPLGCEGERAVINITVNAKPDAPTTRAQIVCLNSTPIALSSGVTATGTLTWYTGSTGGTGSTTAPELSTNVPGSTTYYVSQTSSSGCESDRVSLTYTVKPLSSPPTPTPRAVFYCQGATATPLTASGQNLNWYTSASGGTPTANITPATSLSGSTTYYVSQTDVNGCESNRESVLVTVGEVPGAPAVVPVSYCQNAVASPLSATPIAGASLRWYGTSAIGGTATSDAPTPVVVSGTTNYYVSQAVNGCESPRATLAVTVTPLPQAPSTTPVTVCQNTTPISLATGVTASQGASLNWYRAATGGTASASAPVPPTSTAGQTIYYVSQTVNGCEGPRAALTYTVNALPVATLINDGPLSCAKPTVTLTAGVSGNAYRFSAGATQDGSSNRATVSMSGTYSVTVTDGNGCSATNETVVGSDQSSPQAGLTNDGPLTCAKTTVTLTAAGNGSYRFSAGATPISTGNQATVGTSGIYSVTVTAPNGCSATAQTMVDVNTTVAAPTLTASALSTENTPISVTASGCSGTINWTATGGTGSADGLVYTFTQPGNYGLTATCTVGTCTSPSAPSLSLQIRPGGFAIKGVELVRCQLVDAGRGQYEISFTPQYSGLSGSPVSFGVTNELATTTAPGPYTLRLYTDNATIGLVASQDKAQAAYRYNWLAACSGSQPAPNRPPVAQPIPDQALVVNQNYQLELGSYFTDPDGQALTFTATGLPTGLQLSGSRISGIPAQTGSSTVSVTVLDPGGLQAIGSVLLRVDPAPVNPTPGTFTITGVTGVRCETLSAGERQLSFSPVYTGLTGAPVSFGITNELATTTAPGPYSLKLYTDNPAITLTATQNGTQASYRFSWLAACPTGTTPPTGNRPPMVGTGLGNQTATAGQGYTLFIPAGTFTDPDNDPLQLTVSGLPAGLSFSAAQNAITGTPAQAGSSTVQVTATDPGTLSTSLSFVLTVQPAATTPTPSVFSIAGVTGVRCETLSVGERQLSFSPVYTGLTGQKISFGIINELATTTAPGPYSLRLYTDNPTITLTATQGGNSVSYRYNWLAACVSNPNGRQAIAEAGRQLTVTVLGNPVIGESVEVVIRGVDGQAVELSLTDLAGNRLHQQSIRQASGSEQVVVPVSAGQAMTILKVSTATQHQSVKLIRQ